MTVTALSAVTEERAGAEPRWTPLRAGILNVWRYYDEVFEFHRGRLLLRGPNGSGKSKVLELLLPYVLDASLKPSRLSTFGGTERTMHWNLMGDGATGTTRVGYVWLEFEHPDGRWFTCGARLQATAHTKNVTAAYFTTDLRIGVADGISLSGDGGQPLTRAGLIDLLGSAGKVHESADAYRTAVRHMLYRGLSEQRYDALLTALRQLRTPKLSERLDPGLLSELLSSALPPLGEGEIHEIAEGFERLDRQREELRELDEHVEEADRLAARQRSYAQRVLRAAAAALTSANYQMGTLAAEVKTKGEARSGASADLTETTSGLVREEQREGTLEARIEGLKESEAYKAGRDLHQLRSDARSAAEERESLRGRATETARSAAKKADAAAQALADAGAAEGLADRAKAEAATAAERSGLLAVHQEIASAEESEQAIRGSRELLRVAVTSRTGQLREVRAKVTAHAEAIKRRTTAEQDRDEARDSLAEAVTTHEQVRAVRDECGRELADGLAEWADSCIQLDLDREELAATAELFDQADALVGAAREAAAARLAAREQVLTDRRETLEGERSELMGMRDRLSGETVLEPPAPLTRTADRSTRPGAPLWRAIAFRAGIGAAEQAGVEAALEAAGLLDVWLLPDGGFDPGAHDAFAVDALSRPAPGPSLHDVLVAETSTTVRADAVLSAIAFGPTAVGIDHPAAVGSDGTWRLGPATGCWAKPEPSYIGATARERARRRRIAELNEQIAALGGEIAECERLLVALTGDRTVLAAELARRPDRRPFADAVQELDGAANKVALYQDQLQRYERRLRDREAEVGVALRRLTELSARHGLPTGESALNALEAALRTAETIGGAWLDRREGARTARHRARDAGETAADYQEIAMAAAERAEEAATKAAALAERLAAIDSTLGVEHRLVLDQIQDTERARVGCRRRIKAINESVSRLNQRIGELNIEVAQAEGKHTQAVAARDDAANRFRRLATGHLLADARLTVELAADAGVRAVLDAARVVAEALPAVPFERKNVRDAEARLQEAFHQARETLSERAELELAADDDLQILTAAVGGVRVGAVALSEALRKERDDRRSDITEHERDLFDRTLAGDTRRHLADRIRQATALVDGMNRRLERVRTASQVAVRLVWQVDPNQSAGTRAARDLLLRDPAGLSDADREALYRFFRDQVEAARADNTSLSWEEQLMQVLDYTAWHRFVVRLDRGDGQGWQDLTRKLHGALSGGEKAIALHLPLFAAVAAHYQTDPACPRFILLDEVFVGVDKTNRGQVFDLLVGLRLDLVLTSDHEWCEYREVDGIAIHQLITGDGDNAVTTARFIWNGFRTVPA